MTNKQPYMDRIADKELDLNLKSAGAVLIEGPKWCGKTRTAEGHAASALYLQDLEEEKYILHLLETNPSLLLEGETPRLIDEWQAAKKLWNGIRFAVDRRGGTGHFILTGSVVPGDDSTLHSGTGRIVRMLMRPMALFESMESSGDVSLESVFNGGDVEGTSPLTIEGLAYALVRGGWPASVGEERTTSFRHARNFVKTVMEKDMSRVDNVERNPARVKRLMRSIARNVSTTAKLTTIMDDITGDGNGMISEVTVASYVNALRRLFVIEDLDAWMFAKRSKTAMQTSSKRHFIDPSIAAVMLRLSPEGLLKDFNTFGLLFESLCIRDLRVYAQAIDGEVYHYRDRNGLEIDAVVELGDGRWGAIEVKLGSNEEDQAAKNLLKFKEKVDTQRMGEPSFLMILTATKHAYRRADGVLIVPIGCLKD